MGAPAEDLNAIAESLLTARQSQYTEAPPWRAYTAWCEANRVSALPTAALDGETLLLRFLHAHWLEREWRGENIRIQGGHIARAFVSLGYSDPRGLRWHGYFSAAQKERPGKNDALRVNAFSTDEVNAIRAAIASSIPSDKHVQTAVVVALCDLLSFGPPTSSAPARRLTDADVLLRDDGDLLLDPEGARVLVTASRHPHHHRVIRQALTRAVQAGGGSLVEQLTPSEQDVKWKWRRLRDRCRGAWWRLDRPAGVGAHGATIPPEWWEQASPVSREWLVRYAENPNLEQRTQDLAFFFTALCFGGRFNELQALRQGHLVACDELGYQFRLGADEHKGGRIAASSGRSPRPLDVWVPHLPEAAGQQHALHCPACLLAKHLACRRLRGDSGPDAHVFAGLRSQDKMNKKTASELIQRLWEPVMTPSPDGQLRKVNTRSLRMTTATQARLRGLTLPEVSELLGHRQLSTTSVYIDQHEPSASADLVLGIAEPGAPPPAVPRPRPPAPPSAFGPGSSSPRSPRGGSRIER